MATDPSGGMESKLTLWVFSKDDSLKAVDGLEYKILLTVGGGADVGVLTPFFSRVACVIIDSPKGQEF